MRRDPCCDGENSSMAVPQPSSRPSNLDLSLGLVSGLTDDERFVSTRVEWTGLRSIVSSSTRHAHRSCVQMSDERPEHDGGGAEPKGRPRCPRPVRL